MAAQIIKVGPWGGEGGHPWGDNDGVYSDIRQIIVSYDGVAIGSIQIEYDNDGIPVLSEEHGGNGGKAGKNHRKQIRLNYPREILKSISVFHDTYIRRLACESNLNIVKGPYGSQHENNFKFYTEGHWKIVGFHGRSDAYLRAIGVYLKNLNAGVCSPPISVGPSGGDGLKPISVGPWGGDGGDTWDDVLYSGIHKIRVGYDQGAIVSIHIEYDTNGSTDWKEHGGSHPDKEEEIKLDYPQEILTSISGYYDTYLRSLTFESNLERKYGPYGSEEGTYFSFPISDGKIVSFHGRSDEYLHSIGVHLSNLHDAVPPLCVKVGPWGVGEGGVLWDDGAHSGIRGIRVRFDNHAICYIGIEYDHHGSSFWLEHGNNNGPFLSERRDFEHGDILTSISGYYDNTCLKRRLIYRKNKQQRDFTISRQRLSQSWTYFSIPIMDGKIVGFHGRSDECLRCIGVYLSN